MLVSNEVYHVYNRSNNNEIIFKEKRNYSYFFDLMEQYLFDYLELISYSLMPTHFHVVVKIRSSEKILKNKKIPKRILLLPLEEQVNAVVIGQFRKLFIAYAMAINSQEGRHGSLFQKNFKYKLVDSINYFCTVVAYIHYNSIEADLSENFSEYPHSSYYILVKARKHNWINIKEVIQRFGGRKAFEEFHRIYQMTRTMPKMPSL